MDLRHKIKIRSTVKLTLTADDWELYGKSGREAIACSINELVEEAVNNAADRPEAERNGIQALRTFSDFGALDSEPLRMLDIVLNRAFPV